MKMQLKKFRRVLCALTFGLAMTTAVGCSSATKNTDTTLLPLSTEEQTEKILASMSLSEKVGQMVMIGINETTATDDNLFMLHQYHIGGIILFDKNMQNPEQVRELTATLQREAGEKVPLFFAVDEEGGLVARMKDKLPPPPSAAEVGASGDFHLAGNLAEDISKKLLAMGFNINFAPVADLGTERGRSYSTDPAIATKHIQSAAAGYEKEGMLYCLKHFPGIGKGTVDTHIDSAVVDSSLKELEADDLIPFQTIIKEKNPADYFVMVSHVTYPQLDSGCPASLSKVIQTDVLRDKLGYKGVIITDSVSMGALSKHYSYREIGVKAVKAGADIVLINHDYPYETDLYLGMLDAAEKGEISEERINESVRRILNVKLKHLVAKNADKK